MAAFRTIVMITAAVILVLSLCFIGLALHKQKYSSVYPPVIANCPDYWLDGSGNNGSGCTNTKNIGNPSCATSMDFSVPMFAGQKGGCAKYKWAKQCNLSWDGITNNDSICGV
jgi:hypothetical protein